MTLNNGYSECPPIESSSHTSKTPNSKNPNISKAQQKPKAKRFSLITKIKTGTNANLKNPVHASVPTDSLSQVMTPPSSVPSKRKPLSVGDLESNSKLITLSSKGFSPQISSLTSHPPKKKKESVTFSPRSPTSPTSSNQVLSFPGIPIFKESDTLSMEDPPVPQPPVSIFPLLTTPWMPEAQIFIPLVACMDCTSIFHHDRYLTCNSCAESHHFHCTSLNICSPPPNPDEPWICINCTFCSKCNQSTPRAQLVKCEKCCSVFHFNCTQVSPELLHTGGTIFCHDCTSCYSCGLRPAFSASISPPFWELHPIKTAYHCQTCSKQYYSGNFCIVCFKAYSEVDDDASWVGCDGPCGKWVHKSCDPSLAYLNDTDLKSSSRQYFCPNCSSSTTTTSTTTCTTPTSCTPSSSTPSSPFKSSIPSSTSNNNNRLLPSSLSSCTPEFLSLSRSTSHSSLSKLKESSLLTQLLSERLCAFCNLSDHHPIAGRLIYLGGDPPEAFQRLGGLWAHVGCIHWAVNTSDATIQVSSILKAWTCSKDLICQFCNLPHANIQCPLPNCPSSFHYPCIVLQAQEGMKSLNTPKKKIHLDVFKKRFRCSSHLSPAFKASIPSTEQFDLISTMRLQLIQDCPFPIRLSTLASSASLPSCDPHLPNQFFSLSPTNSRLCIMIGAAIATYLGRFPFEYIDRLVEELPNSPPLLIPIGYTVIRRFWSYRCPGSVTFFTIQKINFNADPPLSCIFNSSNSSLYPNMSEEGSLIFSDETVDPNPSDHFQIPDSANLGWKISVQDDPLNPLYISRLQDIVPSILSRFDPPIPISMNHHYLIHPKSFLLLHHPTIVSLIESLPYAAQSMSYSFQFYDTHELETRRRLERQSHRTCSRTYPLCYTLRFSGPSSPVPSSSVPLEEKKTIEETTISDLSLCSSLHLYQTMKKNTQNFVVKPSKIHGLGLFSLFSLHPGDMVIEYVGEIIGQYVADQRDLKYEVQGKGTFFFALEYDRIIDATVVGNRSRYINHSCSPNCEARIISVEGKKKVIIFAIQKIQPGEEITFDYKFKLESCLEKKLKCHCKGPNCRKFMN